MLTTADAIETIKRGAVLACIGQVSAATKRDLDKLVKRGEISKWRGYWFPVPGASFGIGPLKTCYGLPAIAHIQNLGKRP